MHVLNLAWVHRLRQHRKVGSDGYCGLLRRRESNGRLLSMDLRDALTGMGHDELTIEAHVLACGHVYEQQTAGSRM